jgi:hypothetical protein
MLSRTFGALPEPGPSMPRFPAPPTGSVISVTDQGVETVIEIPQRSLGATRYFHGLFLLVWLGFWVFGFKSVTSQLMAGQGSAFLVFWLAGWTIGGGFAVFTVYRILRPTIPETLTLRATRITYDTGVAPFELSGHQSRNDAWKALKVRRRSYELTRQVLRSLQLRPTDHTNRLTVDIGAERVDLAAAASEIEREWLYRLLVKKYALPSQTASAEPDSNVSSNSR